MGAADVHRQPEVPHPAAGLLASFGNASGPAPAIEPLALSRHGSLFLTRPTLGDYIAAPDQLQTAADALWAVIGSGAVRIDIGAR